MLENVDTTKTTTHLGLCAGYGGIELGLKRVLPALRTVALCEIEAFACANLVAKMEAGLMDSAPIWTDLKTFPWAKFSGKVDILTGGYPCQPFSAAGKRLGANDPRHLWPYIADGIRLMRPRVCFFENVEGHISLGLREVIADLEGLGYAATGGIFSAVECGAPHQRKRVFILAHSNSQRGQLSHWGRLTAEQVPIGNGEAWGDVWPSRPGQPQHAWEPPRVVANAQSKRASSGQQLCDTECGQGRALSSEPNEPSESVGNAEILRAQGAWPKQQAAGFMQSSTMGNAASQRLEGGKQSAAARPETDSITAASGDGQTQPSLGRDTDGSPDWMDYAKLCVTCDNRTDELRLLGNGVVPATVEKAFRTLWNQLK